MKVNLLPKQYIKNDATKFISALALLVCLILAGSTLLIGFYFSSKINKIETDFTMNAIQSKKLDNQISDLQIIHNSDLQKKISDIKSEKYLSNEIMTGLSIAAQASNGQILAYSLIVQNDKNSEKAKNNTNEISMSITIKSPNKIELSKFQKELLKISWCKEAYLKNGSVVTSADEGWQGEYEVRLDKTQDLYAFKTDDKGK